MNTVRLGIIGLGNMGFGHARSLLSGLVPHMTLTAIADTNPERLDWVKAQMPPSVSAFSTAKELMDSRTCDAILIATPHYFHPPYAKLALEMGYHVMSEKPAGVNASAVREMNLAAAAHPELVFGLMFNQRTNPRYRAIKSILESGRLGHLRRSVWTITDWYRTQAYYDSGAWRATWAGEGGGILLNQCPHQLDLWQWLCGMPETVDASMGFGVHHDIEVEDDVCVRVTYQNGATGLFLASTGDPCGVNRLEITLSKGKILCENGTLTVWELDEEEGTYIKSCKDPYRAQVGHVIEVPIEGENSQHVGILNNFADAILKGSPLIAPGREGIRALSLSNAMHLSAWTKSVVTLPPDPESAPAPWEDTFDALLAERAKSSRQKDSASVYTDSDDVKTRYRL